MKKLRLLLKLNGLELFGLNRMRHDPAKRSRAKWLIPLIVIGAIGLLGIIGVYVFLMAYGMHVANMLEAFPVMIAAIAAIMVLFTTIFKAPDALYRMRDFDMLLSLPISEKTVALSRVLNLYSLNILFTLLVMLPSGAAYAWYARPSAGFYVAYVLTMFAIPMVPVVIAAIVGALTAFAGASMRKMRYAGLVLSFVVLIGVMYGSMYLSMNSMEPAMLFNLADGMVKMFSRIYPLAGMYLSGVVYGNIGALFGFIAISVGSLVLAAVIFGQYFVRINTFINAHGTRGNFVLKAQKEVSVKKALLSREWRRYLACNIYVLNTAFALVLSLIVVIALVALIPGELVTEMLATFGLESFVFALLPFLIMALVGTCATTGCSISLEGKNLWIAKSLPISSRDWLMAKLRMNLQLVLPVCVLDAAILAIAFQITGAWLVILILLPILLSLFSALFGLIFNCKVYRLDWTSEMKVVKQSWGTAIPALGSMLLALAGDYLTVKVSAMDHMLFPIVFAAVLAVADLAMWLAIRQKADKWVLAMG